MYDGSTLTLNREPLPEDLVAAARDPNNPLHEFFTWCNEEAGHKWRLEQACQLIAAFRRLPAN